MKRAHEGSTQYLLFVWEEHPKVHGIMKCLHPVPRAAREGESSNLPNLLNL